MGAPLLAGSHVRGHKRGINDGEDRLDYIMAVVMK